MIISLDGITAEINSPGINNGVGVYNVGSGGDINSSTVRWDSCGNRSPLTNDFYVRAYDAHSDGGVHGYWDVSWDSCVWYRYSKIITITAKMMTGGFALRTTPATSAPSLRGTWTMMAPSTTTTTLWIGHSAGGALREMT